jgi:hypothetical protein
MPLRTQSEIITALSQYRAEDIKGTVETTTLDFKRCLYPLDLGKGKFDLCLHVAAMANAAGGLIICGFKADKSPTEVHEQASEITKVPLRLLNVPQHKDVLVQHVWPHVEVGFNFFPYSAEEQDSGFLVIEVQPLSRHERFAMVRRFLNDNGRLDEGFAIPIRHGDQTTYPSVEELHRLMSDGRRFHDLLPSAFLRPPDPATATATLDDRLDALTRLTPTWNELDLPILSWQSFPEQPDTQLDGLYERKGGVYAAFDRPEILRESGFNFEMLGDPPRIESGALLKYDLRRAIRVEPNGTVTAAALATEDMLGWASKPQITTQRLNMFVLTEMTLEYFRLVDTHIVPRAKGPWRHRIRAQRFQQPTTITLGSGGGNPHFPSYGEVRRASAQDWDRSWTAVGDPERDAYEALRHIYALFGLPPTANPFVQENRVDTTALLAAFGR